MFDRSVIEQSACAHHDERQTWSRTTFVLSFVCLTFMLHGIYYLLLGISQPLLDFHSFRQTQTALTAYWLWQGGPWIAYETPVFGYPWSIPFEFPIYQYLVAILKGVGIPIEVGGRLISYAFYLACLWPLAICLADLNFSRIHFFVIAALFLASPIYLYWSRTVMIETCALFFCFLWLAMFIRYLRRGGAGWFVCSLIAGITGILSKSTTFPGFAILGGLAVLGDAFAAWRSRRLPARLVDLFLASLLLLIPLIAGIAWVFASDFIRQQNAFGTFLTSQQLSQHTFGSWHDRVSAALWRDAVLLRAIPDIFGYGAIIAAVCIIAAYSDRRFLAAAFALTAAFFIPFLVFTHLHLVHNYYQSANAVFALMVAGLAICALYDARQPMLAGFLLTALLLGQIYYFHRHFVPVITANYSGDTLYQIARLAREKIKPTESLIVIGGAWAVAYFSERKALGLPSWVPPNLLQQVVSDPQSFLGDSRFAAIVFCPHRLQLARPNTALLQQFVADRMPLGEVAGCQLLAGTKPDKPDATDPRSNDLHLEKNRVHEQ